MFNVFEKRRLHFTVSGVLVLLSIAALVVSAMRFGSPLQLGLETGVGTVFTLAFSERVDQEGLSAVLSRRGLGGATIQWRGAPDGLAWQVRAQEVALSDAQAIVAELEETTGVLDLTESRHENVRQLPSGGTARESGLAVLMAGLSVPLLLWWSFRSVSQVWRLAAWGLVAIVHSLLVACGFYALMGLVAAWKADALFFVALLAAVALTAGGLIAVFSRLRKNLARHRLEPYQMVVKRSVLESVTTCAAVWVTVLLMTVATGLGGGVVMIPPAATLLVGATVGMYSALFLGTSLMAL